MAITETNQRVSQLHLKAFYLFSAFVHAAVFRCMQMYPGVLRYSDVFNAFNVLLCSFAFVIILQLLLLVSRLFLRPFA